MKYGNAGFNGASNVTYLKITCETYAYESCFLKGLIFTETSSGKYVSSYSLGVQVNFLLFVNLEIYL